MDSGWPNPPAFQIETEFTQVTEPTLLLVSPESLAQKWVAGRGGSWRGREGCLLGRVGSRFLTIVQNWKSPERAFSWGSGKGDALLVLRSPSLVPPQSTGDLGWGRLLTAGPAPATPQGAGGESKAFRFEPGRPSSQAEFRDSHWLLLRRDISAEG